MLRARVGDRVQVRASCDEGYALTNLRTPPGAIAEILGTGAGASIVVELASGERVAYSPAELELLVAEPAA